MNQTFETLVLDHATEHVLIIRMNRPEVANALNTQMAHDLCDVLERIAVEPGQHRCIVVTGAGDKAFCAGGDLKQRDGMTDEAWRAQHLVFERMVRAFGDCPVPMIAAVNGAAYGGGTEIALACDFIYASDKARFALPEVTLGIIPGSGGTQQLPRAAGQRRALELLFTGRPFSAEQAHQWGIVNEVFGPSELLDSALETATRIAANAPISTRQIKRSVYGGIHLDLKSALLLEIEAYNHCVPSDDRREGVRAFNEKRKPKFQGL